MRSPHKTRRFWVGYFNREQRHQGEPLTAGVWDNGVRVDVYWLHPSHNFAECWWERESGKFQKTEWQAQRWMAPRAIRILKDFWNSTSELTMTIKEGNLREKKRNAGIVHIL